MRFRKMLVGALTAGMMLSFIPSSVMAGSTGWVEDESGWRYYTSETEYLCDTWKQIGGYWYYFFEDGIMSCDDWVAVGGKLYHFDQSGHMERNKWIKGKGKQPKWRYVGSDGVICSGWKKIDGCWYYFNELKSGGFRSDYGEMMTGILSINSEYYYLDDSGKMRTDCWAKDKYDKWYYFGSDGKIAEGWKKIDGKWYLFEDYSRNRNGMSTGTARIWVNDCWEYWVLEDDGVLTTKTGWYLSTKNSRSDWYYIKSGGKCAVSEWINSNGKWYYFDVYGRMVADKTDYIINNKAYDFSSDGYCINPYSGRTVIGWLETWGEWSGSKELFYGGEDGIIYREKWLSYEGNEYYFDNYGYLNNSSMPKLIDGKIYTFDRNGKATDLTGNNTGWVELDIGRAYIGSDGKAYTGWHQIDGKWYFFDRYTGFACVGKRYADDNCYFFKDNGEMAIGWVKSNGKWYYAGPGGKLYIERWFNYKGSWYYFDDNGHMLDDKSTDYYIEGCEYEFDEDGRCLNPYTPKAAIG